MSQIWPIIISLLSGALLSLVIWALIFRPDFRRDVTAKPGRANIFNVFSVEGVIIVVVIGLLFVGMLYPLTRHESNPQHVRGGVSNGGAKKSTLPAVQQTTSIQDLPRKVAKLQPDSEAAQKIRELVLEEKGPWSPYPKSKEIRISVPGRLPPGKVEGCPEWHGKDLELSAKQGPMEPNDNDSVIIGQQVSVNVSDLMFKASDCRERLGYDLKLNCADATKLFSTKFFECDENNDPKWNEKRRLLDAVAVDVTASFAQTPIRPTAQLQERKSDSYLPENDSPGVDPER